MARRSGGLDAAQIEQIRTKLTAGGRPRVRLSGSQFPPDTVGTVVRIGDPARDGEDYITVRAKVAGAVDELAFAPAELSLGAKPAVVAAPARRVRRAAKPVAASARAVVATAPSVAPAAATESAPRSTSPPPARRQPVRRSSGAAPVAITLVSAGANWTVSVERGARTVVKKASVTPGAVSAVAALLDHPGVSEAVAAVNDTARIEAETRAEQLRAELAQIQAVLDSHRSP